MSDQIPETRRAALRPRESAPPSRIAPHFVLLGVQLAFAAQAVEGKLTMLPRAEGGAGVDPYALVWIRMLAAALFFRLLAMRRPTRAHPSKHDKRRLVFLSIFGIVLNQTFFLLGLRRTSPVSATLVCVAIPVFTAALAAIAGVERATWRVGLGLVLAAAGVLTLSGTESIDRGVLLVTLNSLFYATYLVFGRETIRRLGALHVMASVFGWGAAIFAPIGIWALTRWLPSADLRAWSYVAFVVFVPTIFAYGANAWALGRTTPGIVTAYIFLQPPLAALLARVQLGSPLGDRTPLAAALIALGVVVGAMRRPTNAPTVPTGGS